MNDLKKYAKYVIWIILFYLFTNFLIFIGFNLNYKAIELRGNLPEQISVDKAEATKSQVRVSGKIKKGQNSNLNEKYIKISTYNSNNSNIGTEYIKIEGLKDNEEKSFKMTSSVKEAKSYEITIVENN